MKAEIKSCIKDCFRFLIAHTLIMSLVVGGIFGLMYFSKFTGNLLAGILITAWLIILLIKMNWFIQIPIKVACWILPKTKQRG